MVSSSDFIRSQYSDIMVRHSFFVGLVFLVIAHPETFRTVDKIITKIMKKVTNPKFTLDGNVLLLVHAIVTGVIFYVGSMFITPFGDLLIQQGFRNNKRPVKAPVKSRSAPGKIGRVPRPTNR
jgi:hypothetical protein